MTWEEPLIVQGSHRLSDGELSGLGREYRGRLEQLRRDVEVAS
jgi:hypothetical protein